MMMKFSSPTLLRPGAIDRTESTALHTDSAPLADHDVEKIITAILSGKYSWACVLMLRVMGYNPMDYIPYRTYNRLMKEQLMAKDQD